MPLADWTLETLCARGGTGEVWRARHCDRDVAVVVKVARIDRPRAHDAFAREADALRRLRHPGVARLEEAGRAGDRPWLAVRDAGHTSLDVWGNTARPWTAVRHVLVQLLDALAYVHGQGLVHLDVKPGNVVVSSTLHATLVDFGLARARRAKGGRRAAGTPHYMAPEQVRASWRHLGPWTDLYGLGGLAWRVLTGRHAVIPSAGQPWGSAQLHVIPGPFLARAPVPPGLEGWLRRLLAKRPARRFLSAQAARAALIALDTPTA